MMIGLLLIGDELLSGRIQDANGKWLAGHLTGTGLEIGEIKIIHDTQEAIQKGLNDLFANYDIVLTSGGLGPTDDDKTKFAVADYFKKGLVNRPENDAIIEEHYKRFNKEWNRKNNNYHLMPEDFIITNNPCGLAPGMIFEQDEKMLLCAPGVPREFQALFSQEFLARIQTKFKAKSKGSIPFSIRTYSIPEETIFNDLCPGLWQELEKFGKVSSLPLSDFGGVDIVVTLDNDENLEPNISKIKAHIESTKLSSNVWQYGNLSIAEYIIQLAKEKDLTIAFAESCTGGLAASSITDISGSSSVFMGSVVSYANEVKMSPLGVKEETIKEFGAVSKETALEMAIGARKCCQSDIAISFTGIAGPGGGTVQKPVGTVGIGWSTKDHSESKIYNFVGDRIKLKNRFCNKGLMKLLQLIKSS